MPACWMERRPGPAGFAEWIAGVGCRLPGVSDGKDPLSGRERGDPAVAVRLGVAAALALVIGWGGRCMALEFRIPDAWYWQWICASSLPTGAALTCVALRDRPVRGARRALEALALAVAAWVVAESWTFLFLERRGQGDEVWLRRIADGLVPRYPTHLGLTVGFLLASGWRGRTGAGLAFAIPVVLSRAVVDRESFLRFTWTPYLLEGLLIAAFLPLAERVVARLGSALLEREAP